MVKVLEKMLRNKGVRLERLENTHFSTVFGTTDGRSSGEKSSYRSALSPDLAINY